MKHAALKLDGINALLLVSFDETFEDIIETLQGLCQGHSLLLTQKDISHLDEEITFKIVENYMDDDLEPLTTRASADSFIVPDGKEDDFDENDSLGLVLSELNVSETHFWFGLKEPNSFGFVETAILSIADLKD